MLSFRWSLLVRQLTSPPGPLVILSLLFQNAPITIGRIVTCMFHSFFNSLASSRCLSFFSHSFSFILWSAGQQSRLFCKFSLFFFFLLIIIKSGLLPGIRWSVCMSKFLRGIFYDRFWVVHIPFVSMVESKCLTHFPVNHLTDPVVHRLILPLC